MMMIPITCPLFKTKTKKPLFYLDNIFNNLLIFNTVSQHAQGLTKKILTV